MQFLDKIISHQKLLVAERSKTIPIEKLKEKIQDAKPCRGFYKHLIATSPTPGFIAEIKKASPSAGIIRQDFNVSKLAKSYADGGASCLSVLTNSFFQGEDNHLNIAQNTVDIPILRKDFIVSDYQVYETRALGADAMLLIVSCLNEKQIENLYAVGQDIGIDILVEVHSRTDASIALKIGANLIGVNNRNLKTFEVDLSKGGEELNYLREKKDDITLIAESGIRDINDIKRLQSCGANAFLIGELLMRSKEPEQALMQLINPLTL